MNDDPRLIDERLLRAALRLEADERPPRLDLDALRATARSDAGTSASVAFLGSTSIAILSIAGITIALRIAALVVATLTTGDGLAVVIGVITDVAEQLDLLLAIVTQPAVPIAIVACLIVAMYYERRHAEEDGHVPAR